MSIFLLESRSRTNPPPGLEVSLFFTQQEPELVERLVSEGNREMCVPVLHHEATSPGVVMDA